MVNMVTTVLYGLIKSHLIKILDKSALIMSRTSGCVIAV
jgi:hypothetical protein